MFSQQVLPGTDATELSGGNSSKTFTPGKVEWGLWGGFLGVHKENVIPSGGGQLYRVVALSVGKRPKGAFWVHGDVKSGWWVTGRVPEDHVVVILIYWEPRKPVKSAYEEKTEIGVSY